MNHVSQKKIDKGLGVVVKDDKDPRFGKRGLVTKRNGLLGSVGAVTYSVTVDGKSYEYKAGQLAEQDTPPAQAALNQAAKKTPQAQTTKTEQKLAKPDGKKSSPAKARA